MIPSRDAAMNVFCTACALGVEFRSTIEPDVVKPAGLPSMFHQKLVIQALLTNLVTAISRNKLKKGSRVCA